MKKFALSACVVCFLLSTASADPPRDAATIVKEYNEVKLPTVDPAKTSDQAWVRQYMDERNKANSKEKVNVLYNRAMILSRSGRMDVKDVEAATEEFIQAAPKDTRGASLLTGLARLARDKDQRVAIYRRIIADYQGAPGAKYAAGSLRQIDEVGKPFDLQFKDAITDKTVSIKGLNGKVVVIDFWATWCGPCVAEMPKMKELYAKYKDKGVEFIGVSLDQPGPGLDKLKTFVAEKDIQWPQYYQGKYWDSEFSQSWGINSIPSVFIVDAQGNLHSTEARGKLETLIPELIKKRDG